MLRSAKTLENYALRARDGDIGHVKDFYFDDQHWHIRYFVVDTGRWLASRRVLISPDAVSGQLWADRVIPVDLTQDQVRNSPTTDVDQAVSRQHEMELRHHYGWPPYWGVVFPEAGLVPPTPVTPPDSPYQHRTSPDLRKSRDAEATAGQDASNEPRLRSTGEVTGYKLEAADGAIGHVEDFLIDDTAWQIRYLVINTRNWLPGKKVIVAPNWIRHVSWTDSLVRTDLTRASIKGSPEYDSSQPITAEYAAQLHDYYGRPRYPDWDPEHKSPESRRNFRS